MVDLQSYNVSLKQFIEKSSSFLQSVQSAGLYKKEVVELRLFSTIFVLFNNKTQWEKDWSLKYLLWPFLSTVCCQNKMALSIFFSLVLYGFRQGLNLVLIKGKSRFVNRFVWALNEPLTAHICIFAMEARRLELLDRTPHTGEINRENPKDRHGKSTWTAPSPFFYFGKSGTLGQQKTLSDVGTQQ